MKLEVSVLFGKMKRKSKNWLLVLPFALSFDLGCCRATTSDPVLFSLCFSLCLSRIALDIGIIFHTLCLLLGHNSVIYWFTVRGKCGFDRNRSINATLLVFGCYTPRVRFSLEAEQAFLYFDTTTVLSSSSSSSASSPT